MSGLSTPALAASSVTGTSKHRSARPPAASPRQAHGGRLVSGSSTARRSRPRQRRLVPCRNGLRHVATSVKDRAPQVRGSASHRRTSRSGSARRSASAYRRRVSSTPGERHHEREQRRARQVEVRQQVVDAAELEAGRDEELGAPRRAARRAATVSTHAHRRRADRQHARRGADPLPGLGRHLVALAVDPVLLDARPPASGRNVSSPTCSVTRSTVERAPSSSGVKCRPAVGAAAEPGSRGVDRLVAARGRRAAP